jgi:hypothetical protein
MEATNPFRDFYATYDYAQKHGRKPTQPGTWDDAYRARMQELAGIIPKAHEELDTLSEAISKQQKKAT